MSDTIPVALIAAVARNGVIGDGIGMPWRLSTDMKRFKALTIGKPVVMGRKTFESLKSPLKERTNIVVSRRPDFAPDGVVTAQGIPEALEKARLAAAASDAGEIMVIGGGEIYAATIAEADRLYLTHVESEPDGETLFPEIRPETWRLASEERVPAGERDSAPTRFAIYERRRGPDDS